MKRSILYLALCLLLAASCNEPYDPIGPNKPSPVLLVTPLELAFDGAGGTLSSTISTNADNVTVESAPEWVASATVSDDLSSITVIVEPNKASLKPREGVIRMACSSGDNTVTQYLKLFQAGNGCKMAFAAFSGKQFPAGWTAEDPSKVAIGNGYLAISAEGNPGYLYSCPQEFNPSAQRYYFSVDMKMGGEGGAKLYVNDNPLQVIEIYLGYNPSANRGGIWVRNGETWLAMDDGVVGASACDNQYNEMHPLPEPEDRDDWWRVEVFTTETGLNQPVVQVSCLKTFNGELQTTGVNYSRKFNVVTASVSKVALWGRNFESQFRNYVLSYQE